jgi:2-oxoglutarate ferredoxin oxidoreductase subunit delta
MAKVIGAVEIDTVHCKGCNLCVTACPCSVLALQPREVNDRGYHFAYAENAEKCIGCAACATVCPDACIEVYRVVASDQTKA